MVRHILVDCGVRIPQDLDRICPVFSGFQMGVMFFWMIDESPDQTRTGQLLDLAAKSVASLIRLSTSPLMRPVRKSALKVIEVVKGANLSPRRDEVTS